MIYCTEQTCAMTQLGLHSAPCVLLFSCAMFICTNANKSPFPPKLPALSVNKNKVPRGLPPQCRRKPNSTKETERGSSSRLPWDVLPPLSDGGYAPVFVLTGWSATSLRRPRGRAGRRFVLVYMQSEIVGRGKSPAAPSL